MQSYWARSIPDGQRQTAICWRSWSRRYEAPLTPLERVRRAASIPAGAKRRLHARFHTFHPLDLLHSMRQVQPRVAQCGASDTSQDSKKTTIEVSRPNVLSSLGTAWQEGEIRRTPTTKLAVHTTSALAKSSSNIPGQRYSKWLETEPSINAKQLYERLTTIAPTLYSGTRLRPEDPVYQTSEAAVSHRSQGPACQGESLLRINSSTHPRCEADFVFVLNVA